MVNPRVRRWVGLAAGLAALGVWPAARAGGSSLSPQGALEAMPAPAGDAAEARLRYDGRVDRAVESLRGEALARVGGAARELGRQEPFDRDQGSIRAAAFRVSADEATALLAMERLRTAEPVERARPIE